MSKLSTYLKATNQTQSAFAKRIGISQNYLSEISRGLKEPSGKLAYEIETATDGKIPMSHWFSPDAPGKAISHEAINNASTKTEDDNGRVTDR